MAEHERRTAEGGGGAESFGLIRSYGDVEGRALEVRKGASALRELGRVRQARAAAVRAQELLEDVYDLPQEVVWDLLAAKRHGAGHWGGGFFFVVVEE